MSRLTAPRVAASADRSSRGDRYPPAWTPWALAALVSTAAAYGLVAADAYRVVDYLAAIWRAQDAVTIAALPPLVWSAARSRAGSLRHHLLWLGLLCWLVYAYAHYAFGVPHNPVFLCYVAIVGIAGFGLLDGLLRIDVFAVAHEFAGTPRRAAAWTLTVGGLGIGGVWLSEILAAFPAGRPASNLVADLPSPTYVLDLAWIIPMALAAGALLRRRHPAGPVLAAVTLVMLTVLSAAMLALTVYGTVIGLAAEPRYAGLFVGFGAVFGVLLIVCVGLLARGARRMGHGRAAWLRADMWR